MTAGNKKVPRSSDPEPPQNESQTGRDPPPPPAQKGTPATLASVYGRIRNTLLNAPTSISCAVPVKQFLTILCHHR